MTKFWYIFRKMSFPSSLGGQDFQSTRTKPRDVVFLVYNMQAVSSSKKTLHRGIIKPSMVPIAIKTKQDPASINEVRIVSRADCCSPPKETKS
jgi:hypothetical protein